MIVLFLEGGLGNQLIQYSAALTLSEMRGKDSIIIDTDSYIKSDRKYELYKYKLKRAHIATEIDRNKYKIVKRIIMLCKRYINKGVSQEQFNRNFKYLLNWFGIYCDTSKITVPLPKNILKYKKNIYLSGFFIKPQFVGNLIEIELKRKSKELKMWENSIVEGEHVCVHIRLGDYVSNKCFEVCTKEYYYRGMEYISENIENPIFHIFSDDLKKVKREFQFVFPVIYEDEHNNAECLIKMSLCKHFILSNSTFSWCAQKLSKRKEKIVIAPTHWYKDKETPFYLYDDIWKLIEP